MKLQPCGEDKSFNEMKTSFSVSGTPTSLGKADFLSFASFPLISSLELVPCSLFTGRSVRKVFSK